MFKIGYDKFIQISEEGENVVYYVESSNVARMDTEIPRKTSSFAALNSLTVWPE